MGNLKQVILQFSCEELEIIKSNAELMIDDISKASDVIDAKANTYFSVLLLIIVSSLGYIVGKYDKIDYSNLILHEIVLMMVMCVISLRQIHHMLLPKGYRLKGTMPEFHINYENYGNDKKKEILKDSITTFQSIIDHNLKVHEDRVNKLTKAIDYIVSGIIISIIYAVGYIIISFLFSR